MLYQCYEAETGRRRATHLVDFGLQVTQLDLKVGLLIDDFVLEFCVLELRVR